MKYLNQYEIKAVLDSKKIDFQWENFSKKELINILSITFMLYRRLNTKYNILECCYNNKK